MMHSTLGAGATLSTGDADLVSFDALFIANPDLPEHFATNAAVNIPDKETFNGGEELGYPDYPFLASQPGPTGA